MRISLIKSLHHFSNTISRNNKPTFEYLYGINPIQLAFAAKRRQFQKLILSDSQTIKTSYKVTKIINAAQEFKIPIIFSPKDKMTSLVKGQPHQNIILKCSILTPTEGNTPQKYPQGIYVFCDKITDPQNLGAIIRSSLFFGVKNIFVSKKSISPLNSTVSKASSGALQVMQVHTVPREQQFLKQWSQNLGLVVSTSVNNQTVRPISPYQCREHILKNRQSIKKVLLILGSQGYGVSPHLSRNSNISVCINRTGQMGYPYELVDSLNVNSALSTILYQLTRNQ